MKIKNGHGIVSLLIQPYRTSNHLNIFVILFLPQNISMVYRWSARNCLQKNRYICQKKRTRIDCSNLLDKEAHKKFCRKRDLSNAAPGFLSKYLELNWSCVFFFVIVMKDKKEISRNHYELATLVCLPDMILIGKKCYFFSVDKLSWSDAYWVCRDKSTKFAVLTTRMQDKILRRFLNANFTGI